MKIEGAPGAGTVTISEDGVPTFAAAAAQASVMSATEAEGEQK